MPYPIKTCVVCGEEFELTPNKPGFANRCPECTENDEAADAKQRAVSDERNPERDAARRDAMKNLLYRKDE
jgi:predicted RNA-binding Zn-ribbon protein involved in translation (DUF1610 family)